MNAVLANVRQLVDVELAAANERFPQFHSLHVRTIHPTEPEVARKCLLSY